MEKYRSRKFTKLSNTPFWRKRTNLAKLEFKSVNIKEEFAGIEEKALAELEFLCLEETGISKLSGSS